MMKTVLLRLSALLFIVAASYNLHATNYSSNGGNSSYSLNNGDTLFLQKNNFFGSINSFPTGSVIVVQTNATFAPGTLTLYGLLGKILNYGTCTLPGLGFSGGISIENYGTINVHGDMSFYTGSGQYLTNYSGSKLIITGNLSLSDNTTITNNGTLSVGGSMNLYVSTASFINQALTVIGGSLNNQGQLN